MEKQKKKKPFEIDWKNTGGRAPARVCVFVGGGCEEKRKKRDTQSTK